MSGNLLGWLQGWLRAASVIAAAAAAGGTGWAVYDLAGDGHGAPLRLAAALFAGALAALFAATPYLVAAAGLALLNGETANASRPS